MTILIKKNRNRFSCIPILLIVIFILCSVSSAEDQKNNLDDFFWSWFTWKYINASEPSQKEVIFYFKKINKIFAEAEKTRFRTEESFWGDPDISRAISTTDRALKDADDIKPPEICRKHYVLTMEILKELSIYQTNRFKFRNSKLFEQETKGIISGQLLNEEKRQKEYFIVLRKIGFYDHFFDEIVQLKLVTKHEAGKMRIQAHQKIKGSDLQIPI